MTVWLQNQLLILHGFILISKGMSKVKLECLISKTEIHVALILLHHLPCRFFSDIQTIHTFSENLVFLSRSFCIPPASHSSITKYIRCKCEEMHNIYMYIKPIMIKKTVMALISDFTNCTVCHYLKVLYFRDKLPLFSGDMSLVPR